MKAYIYGHPSGAHFVSRNGLSLQLSKGDRFEIGKKGEQDYVVLNGKGIRITPAERKDLVKKSKPLKPSAEHNERTSRLYEDRKALEETAVRYLKELEKSRGVSAVTPFYTRNEVGAIAASEYGHVVISANTRSIGVAIYCKDKGELKSAVEAGLWAALKRRASRYIDRFDGEVEDSKEFTAHMGNVQVPALGKFSGTVRSYYANWS